MYLLAHIDSNKLSWKDVGAFMQNRTSTQVRTHVQKFRTKTMKLIKEVESIRARIESQKQHKPPTKPEYVVVETLCREYLAIIKSAQELGSIKTEDGQIMFKEKIVTNE